MNKKSDTRKFLETMWIMAKYDVLPWLVGAGILAAVIIGASDAKSSSKVQNKTIELKHNVMDVQNHR